MKVSMNHKDYTPTYPCVLKHSSENGITVLFTEEGKGICLSPPTHVSYGKHTSGWSHINWEPCCITLDSTGE